MTNTPQPAQTDADDRAEATQTTADAEPSDVAPAASGDAVSVEHGELVDTPVGDDAEVDNQPETNSVTEPAKVMRIGSMVKQLLEEVRQAPLDEASRERLAEVYERSVVELSEALSPDLEDELKMLTLPFDDDAVPSESELRVAQAQLVGWLEGLFHGIQATLMAQQVAARQQLEQMRQLPPGMQQQPQQPGQRMPGQQTPAQDRPGTYL